MRKTIYNESHTNNKQTKNSPQSSRERKIIILNKRQNGKSIMDKINNGQNGKRQRI